MARRVELPNRVWKFVYARSGNQCAFDGCVNELASLTPGDNVALTSQLAHIIGASSEGPRGVSDMSAEERAKPGNIILLCSLCHQRVDQDPARYTPEVLRAMKERHEARHRAAPELPRTLPRKALGFKGRDAELAAATARLIDAGTVNSVARAAVLYSGPPGIGKTELAVQLALVVSDRYPGGQIFLRGASSGGTRDLVGDLLSLMTGDRAEAASADLRIGTLGELLSRARMLIVVDDVKAEAEILPLLEIEGDFGLVATSRSRLSGLTDAGILCVGVERISQAAGVELAREISPRLSDVEAQGLTEACGGHPLALRIAASRLASRPALDVACYISKLASDDGLEHLVAGDRTVVRVINDSYQSLDRDEMALIIGLGQLPPVPLPLEIVAVAMRGEAALGNFDKADQLLDRLFEKNLIEQPAPGIYQLHDLLHLFARGQAEAAELSHSPLLEASKAYAHRLRSAHPEVVLPAGSPVGSQLGQEAITTMDRDRQAALAIVELATKRCLWEALIEIAGALNSTLLLRGCWRDLLRVSFCQRTAGEQCKRPDWISSAEYNSAVAASHMGDFEAATNHFSRCEELALQAGDLVTLQATREAYGDLLLSQGRYTDGIPLLKMSLPIWREARQRRRLASTLYRLGISYLNIGDLRTAERYLINGRQVAGRTGLGDRDLDFSLGLSRLYRLSGRWELSERECLAALDAAQRSGDRQTESLVLLELGTARLRKENKLDARACLEQALNLFREMENRVGETKALRALAIHHREAGRPLAAADHLDQSYAMALELGLESDMAHCLADLAVMAADCGRSDADAMFAAAEDIAEGTGSKVLLSQIQHAHGLMLLRSGRYSEAADLLRRTWLMSRQETDSDARASVQLTLGEALIHCGQYGRAGQVLQPIAKAVSGTPGDGLKAAASRLLAVLYSRRQLWAEAESALKNASALAKERADGGEELECLATEANLYARQGKMAEGIAAFDRAIEIALQRTDARVLVTLQANRWSTVWRSNGFENHEAAINDCDEILDLAKQGSMPWIRVGLLHNKGACLAEAGQLDAAVEVLEEARDLVSTSTHHTDRARVEMSLAATELRRGRFEHAARYAADARLLAEASADWLAAASALTLQVRVRDAAEVAGVELVDSQTDKAIRPESLAALHAQVALQAEPDQGEIAPQGRVIRIGTEVRAAMEKLGIDVDSFVPWARDSTQPCVLCDLPIAADGDAALIVATPRERGVDLVVRLAHTTCSSSALVNWTGPLNRDSNVRFDMECVLLGPDRGVAAVVVDCFGGWDVGGDGKVVDALLMGLRQHGFIDVQNVPALTNAKPPFRKLSASIDGAQLRLSGLGDAVFDLPLQFNKRWYRAAAEQQSLLIMFGRNLPVMTWEDSSYLQRAAASSRLVAAMAPLQVHPPGRNAVCVCEAETALKFKRCCGAP